MLPDQIAQTFKLPPATWGCTFKADPQGELRLHIRVTDRLVQLKVGDWVVFAQPNCYAAAYQVKRLLKDFLVSAPEIYGEFLRALGGEPWGYTAIAIEPDPIYNRILLHLYSEPQGPWKIRATTLEKAGLVEPTFDLIVGNAPFGDWGVSDSNCPASLRHRHLQSKVHDYFLCKAVSLLLPGGVCAMITHRSTLDRESVGVREWLATRSELVGAWRLPAELWGDQGAAPVADVLVLRRNGARV